MSPKSRPNITLYTALAANVGISAMKFLAGAFSHSSAMIAEAVHSLVDSVNELLVLYGIRRSNKERDPEHPFGYGREIYFWSFVVSIFIFSFGACVAFAQGYLHLRRPVLLGPMKWNYIVLAFSLVFDGGSLAIAWRRLRQKTSDPLLEAIEKSKDPTDFMVLLEDGASVAGVLIVAALLFIGQQTQNPYLDGVASIIVGAILTLTSLLLARETRSLLIGEGISRKTEQRITDLLRAEPFQLETRRIFSLYQGPDDVLLILVVHAEPGLSTAAFAEKIVAVREKIKADFQRISYVVIQPE